MGTDEDDADGEVDPALPTIPEPNADGCMS